MRTAVVGAGGVGGYVAARLAQSGADVVLIARAPAAEIIGRQGLRVDSVAGDVTVHLRVAASPAQAGGRFDLVIAAIRADQLAGAAPTLAPLLADGAAVLPLQNGVDAPDVLQGALGPRSALGGLISIFSQKVAPGHVRHIGWSPTVTVGELDRTQSPRVAGAAALLERAGLDVRRSTDVLVDMWSKLILMASWAGLSATTGATIDALLAAPGTRERLAAALREGVDVGRARGIRLPADAEDQLLARAARIPPGSTSSLERDIVAGRPSELEHWSGALVRIGRELDVPTPVHDDFCAALSPLEQRARRRPSP